MGNLVYGDPYQPIPFPYTPWLSLGMLELMAVLSWSCTLFDPPPTEGWVSVPQLLPLNLDRLVTMEDNQVSGSDAM